MPTIEQRIAMMISNLETSLKDSPPDAPHLLVTRELKNLAEIVREIARAQPEKR